MSERPERDALDRSTVERLYDRVATVYDLRHAILTAGSDRRGRTWLVERAVATGDRVLDAGAGTGPTALRAADRAGSGGRVVACDLSRGMLEVARRRAIETGPGGRIALVRGDLHGLPFPDGAFDAALSTYGVCPLGDPVAGALELYRVVRPGGRVGIAHSAEPAGRIARWLAERVEDVAWRFPSLSLGCRAVSVRPALERIGARTVASTRIGVPLWPFTAFVVGKPDGG